MLLSDQVGDRASGNVRGGKPLARVAADPSHTNCRSSINEWRPVSGYPKHSAPGMDWIYIDLGEKV
ncbi:hypothetical protein ABH922_005300 [Rhodococcus sp. 27YEA15]